MSVRLISVLCLTGVLTMAVMGCNRSDKMPGEKVVKNVKPITIVIIGDSTVATNPEGSVQAGWGQYLRDSFESCAAVNNHARNGRSSKSFVDEGLWAKALSEKPDYVFVQFGHNDQPGKGPERETDPATTYKDYLRNYIDQSRAAGAEVVLVTSTERRHFDESGHIKQTLKPWALAVKEVGKEKNVFVIDLHDYSVRFMEKLGDAKSLYLNRDDKDRTHWSHAGAKVWADYVASRLRKAPKRYEPLKDCLR